jgi:hypothetical protein
MRPTNTFENNSQNLATFFVQNNTRTRKHDFLDLLAADGRYYLPPRRNMSARFVSDFLAGDKKLFKLHEIRLVSRVWRFKNCTCKLVWESFPEKELAIADLPDIDQLEKIDKSYLFTVK